MNIPLLETYIYVFLNIVWLQLLFCSFQAKKLFSFQNTNIIFSQVVQTSSLANDPYVQTIVPPALRILNFAVHYKENSKQLSNMSSRLHQCAGTELSIFVLL